MEDPGPPKGVLQQTDDDYAAWVERIVGSHPSPASPTQLFAYGSLIWKPEIEYGAEQIGIVRGWHRSFCLRIHRFRGTPTQPGLMMALDRGGQCKGVLYELPAGNLTAQFDKLFRREFTVKPNNTIPRWLTVETASGPVQALGFVSNRASSFHVQRLPPEEVAEILAIACGHWGTGAEYLLNTVTGLENRGIRDSHLWNLQRLVAEKIDGQPA